MKYNLKRIVFTVALALTVSLSLSAGVANFKGATPLHLMAQAVLPHPVPFRHAEGRGLLVRTWVNGSGPFTFAIDTGAGATILSDRVAREAGVDTSNSRPTEIGGLSGASVAPAREASRLRSLAIGERDNLLPSSGTVVVTNRLPLEVDGVLDPTEAFWPLGYVIDMPNSEISSFNPRLKPLRRNDLTPGGAVVPWIVRGSNRRPFVRLADGRSALIDTGSSLGFALSATEARAMGIDMNEERHSGNVRRDLGGGRIIAHRVRPVTLSVGSLTLRNVPTDILDGVATGSPLILGRDALQPFQLVFDPVNRLIQFKPGDER
jgi:predicted aspartyl protease